jgi:hypothetical protein
MREGLVLVPHVGIERPMAYQSGGNMAQSRSHVPIGLVCGTVDLKLTQATVPLGWAQFIEPYAFLFSKLTQICKL